MKELKDDEEQEEKEKDGKQQQQLPALVCRSSCSSVFPTACDNVHRHHGQSVALIRR